MSTPARLYGLDVLRGAAMLLGLVLHGSIAYQAGVRFVDWIDDTTYDSYFFDWLYLTINSFRMQLFFVLAGFFSHLVLQRKGMKYFVKNRFQRIVVPFVLSYFLILPATLAPYLYYQYSQEGVDAWEKLKETMIQFFTFGRQWGVMHLWFLYYLILYYFVAFGWEQARRVISKKTFSFGDVRNPGLAMLALTLCVGSLAQFYGALVPTIWTGLKPPIVQFAYYALFYFTGWTLYRYKSFLGYIDARYKMFLVVALILSVAHVVVVNIWFPTGISDEIQGSIFKFSFAFQTVALSAGCIGLFNTLFSQAHTTGQYLSESAYWVYLVHLPVILLLQLLLLNSSVPGYLRFPIVVCVSTSVALLSYHFLVRNRWIGFVLNGKK